MKVERRTESCSVFFYSRTIASVKLLLIAHTLTLICRLLHEEFIFNSKKNQRDS